MAHSELLAQAGTIVRACADMAERFRSGGTLYVLGAGPAASDARHIAVEFVHPVLVGKRALPSRHLAEARDLSLFARPGDIALAVSPAGLDDVQQEALTDARGSRVLTVALVGGDAAEVDADHVLRAPGDRLAAQELQVTTYHLLWELVHVVLELGDRVGDDVPAAQAGCAEGHCVTCADEAVQVRVVGLLDGGYALVDTGSGTEQVSVALVEAQVGDTVLVHAGEAIGVVPA